MKVGCIGLGGMGKHIASRIVEAGFEVTVLDIRQAPVDELLQLGARSAGSAREVAAVSDVVLSSLSSLPASREVALGEDGVLAGAETGDVYIETSTVGPGFIRELAAAGKTRGVAVLDAPVSGGIAAREQGTLTVMVGGDASTLERVRPVLEAFGERIIHAGPSGSGATVKLLNNLTVASNYVAAMEALVLGVKAGLSVEVIREVISNSSGASRVFEGLVENVMTRDSVPPEGEVARQGLHTLVKDVTLASELARELSVPLLLGSTTAQAYLAGEAAGLSDEENWALMKVFEALAGVSVRGDASGSDRL